MIFCTHSLFDVSNCSRDTSEDPTYLYTVSAHLNEKNIRLMHWGFLVTLTLGIYFTRNVLLWQFTFIPLATYIAESMVVTVYLDMNENRFRDLYRVAIGKTAIKIYGFSGGIRPGVGLQGGIRATSTLQWAARLWHQYVGPYQRASGLVATYKARIFPGRVL